MIEFDMFEAEFTGEIGERTEVERHRQFDAPRLGLRLLTVAESEAEARRR